MSASTFPSLWRATPGSSRALLGLAGVSVAAACLWFFPFWIGTPELAHAFVAPLLSGWLWYASRQEPSWLQSPWPRRAALAGWGIAGVGLVAITTLSILAQGLMHTQSVTLGAWVLVVLLGSILLALDQGPDPIVRCNGASLAGIALWLLAVPLPPGPLTTLTLALRDQTTVSVLTALHWLGYPVVRHGNILEFPHCIVGVEDACSGIRSLLACTFTGLFIAGLLLRGLWPRLLFVLGCGALAVVANFFRSLTLCLLLNAGLDIAGTWHDVTAYVVLGGTTVIMYGAAVWLARHPRAPRATQVAACAFGRQTTAILFPLGLATLIVVATGFIVWRTRVPAESQRPVPPMAQLLRCEAPGWTSQDNPAIQTFAGTLGTTHLYDISYRRPDTEVTVFMAYWEAGQSTLGLVSLHQPDYCMPSAGWQAVPAPAGQAHYPLGPPQRFTFTQGGYVQHVWFWHFYDGRVVDRLPGFLPWHVGPYLLRQPVSARAPQWVIRVASNRPLEELQNEPLLQELFRHLTAAGLAERQL